MGHRKMCAHRTNMEAVVGFGRHTKQLGARTKHRLST